MPPRLDSLPQVEIFSLAEWRRWLTDNHARAESIWLVTLKKATAQATGRPYLAYGDIVDEALCFGWIDSLPRSLDERRTMLLLSPRKPTSVWSKINRDKVERLVAEGRMMPPGLAKIAAAKANGRWAALLETDRLDVPPDLAEALAANADAERRFGRFPPSSRRGILEWISMARKPATRLARIRQTVELAAQNRKANFPKGRDSGPPDTDRS